MELAPASVRRRLLFQQWEAATAARTPPHARHCSACTSSSSSKRSGRISHHENGTSDGSSCRNWLFFGSDLRANAAANLFSLIASCQLHGLEPETYLRNLIRVLPHFSRGRHLELAPKYWSRTLGRLDPQEIEMALGFLTRTTHRRRNVRPPQYRPSSHRTIRTPRGCRHRRRGEPLPPESPEPRSPPAGAETDLGAAGTTTFACEA